MATFPAGGIGLLIGVERLIAPGIAVCNVIGNVVATLVIARSEGRLDMARFASAVGASSRPTPVAEPPARLGAVPPQAT